MTRLGPRLRALLTRGAGIAALLTNPEAFSSGMAVTQTGTERPTSIRSLVALPLQLGPSVVE
jgi:hypothetical protein